MSEVCHPRAKRNTEITEEQIHPIGCAQGEELLCPLLKSDGEGEEQGHGDDDPPWGLMSKRTQKGQVEEERESPVEEEMSRLVAVGKLIDESQRAELTGVRKDDDEDDQEREKYSDRFQSRFSF